MGLRGIYIILLGICYHSAAAQSSYFWKPELISYHNASLLIGFDQQEQLWMLTLDQKLLKKTKEGEFKSYALPVQKGEVLSVYLSFDNVFYISRIDSDYRTRFISGHPETGWHTYDHVELNATRHWAESPDGILYVVGDWGSVLRIDPTGKRIETIRIPYENHITAVYSAKDALFMGIRNVGLVRFSETGFQIMQGSEQVVSDISGVFSDLHPAYPSFFTLNGHYYQWAGNSYELIDQIPVDQVIKTNWVMAGDVPFVVTTYGQVYRYEDREWLIEYLPTNNLVYSIAKDKEGQVFAMDSKGVLYHRIPGGEMYFTQFLRIPALIGNSLDLSYSMQSIDINGDGLQDILLNSKSRYNPVQIYIQHPNGQFADETALYFRSIPENIEQAFLEDLSGDGITDLISLSVGESFIAIHIYLQFDRQFVPHFQLSIPSDSVQELRAMQLVDFDKDGDQDVMLGFYYGKGRRKGSLALLKNDGWGHLEADHLIHPEFRQWTSALWTGDLNNDQLLDVYVGSYWQKDYIISAFNDPVKQSIYELPDTSNTFQVLGADLDRDGRPEIIRYTRENGVQAFEVSDDFRFTEKQGFYPGDHYAGRSFFTADMNSDGWLDLVINGTHKDTTFTDIWLNEQDGYLSRTSEGIGLPRKHLGVLFPMDFDGDGDYDLVSLNEGDNELFENHADPSFYIKLKMEGASHGLTEWMVEMGSESMKVFSNHSGFMGSKNSEWLLGANEETYIPKVYSPRQTLKSELVTDGAPWYLLVSPDHSFLEKAKKYLLYYLIVLHFPSFYYYTVTVFAAILLLMITYYIGKNRLSWESNSLFIVTLANSMLFWILVVLSYNLKGFWSFGIPMSGVLAGSMVPVIFSLQNQYFNKQSKLEEKNEKLLDLMLRFTHGAWSYSVINSLHMLLQNYRMGGDDHLNEKLNERKDSFRDIVLPELKQIKNCLDITHPKGECQRMLSNILQYFEGVFKLNLEEFLQHSNELLRKLEELSDCIRFIRQDVWSRFSSDMIAVVQQVTDLHKEKLSHSGIQLIRRSDGSSTARVLIPASRLAELVDNFVLNAEHAMTQSEVRNLVFFIYHKAPKWVLEVEDTGVGIAMELHDKIFDSGFSKHNSTGQGLFKSRESLSRFGGHISILKSIPGEGTTFKIELLEGV